MYYEKSQTNTKQKFRFLRRNEPVNFNIFIKHFDILTLNYYFKTRKDIYLTS